MAIGPVSGISVYYDAHCPFCRSCADWLGRRATHLPLRLVPAHSPEARERAHMPWLGRELVVVHDDGRFWAGPAAFIVCLWALAGGRTLSEILAWDPIAPLSIAFFEALSAGRGRLAWTTGHRCVGACDGGAYR